MRFLPPSLVFLTLRLALALASPLSAFSALVAPSSPLKRATQPLELIPDFGPNTSKTKMYIYVPPSLSPSPAILVAIHHCTGTAQGYYASTPYAQLADQKGFLVIFPESSFSGSCWDVSSLAALTHGGGGDSESIANMVRYAVTRYRADAGRVFVAGSSSGAMMTNVLAATYPGLFAAAIVYSGVPAGCFFSQAGGANQWNMTCSQGQARGTSQVWAKTATDMDPGYNGTRPRMQIYHGSSDDTLLPGNWNETIKQWCGVFGLDYTTPEETRGDTPDNGYTTYRWDGDRLVGVYAVGVGHTVPVHGAEDMKFFGL